MTEKRANMTEEEKEKVKEKDRLRKKKMREKKKQEKMMDLKRRVKAGEFAHKGTYRLAKDKRFKHWGIYKDDKKEMDKRYKKKMRKQRSPVYQEFDRFDNLLTKRRMREERSGKDLLFRFVLVV